ncbi:hypothetical protein ACFV2V_25160 [Streptomyces sp. NPDC059698]|uniref:hypothetical protein n=1 Tax=unclassified Streptomyces TaxID=2593676 RepID=UPI0011615544|nr:hypothetical protein [Streptomyces sp. CB02366]
MEDRRAAAPIPLHCAPFSHDPAEDVTVLREWVQAMEALPEPASVVPRHCPDCGGRGTVVIDGRRRDRVHGACGSCCECSCPTPTDNRYQPCGSLTRQQCPACRCCMVCTGCHCEE